MAGTRKSGSSETPQGSLFDLLEPARKPTLSDDAETPEIDDEVDDHLSPELLKLIEDELEAEVAAAADKGPRVFSVSELATELKDFLDDSFGQITVRGEIADFKGVHRNGHLYCGLKDEKSQIRMVMWKGSIQKVPFELKAGLEVVITGRLDFYGGSGSLQIIAERIDPVGMGALQLRFEQLKEKLKLEGLFDVARKRKISPLNWRIGVVTSTTTAALQDILRIYRTRFPLAEIFVFHAAVQGDKAPSEIVAAINRANRYSAQASKPLDVLVVGRGGGSYEDLFCFNDENLARALAASKIPTVSAVGHEIDFTISDMVADKRAATPSHAAQETVPEVRLWVERLQEIERLLERRAQQSINDHRLRIDTFLNRIVAAAPQKRLAVEKDLVIREQRRLETLIQNLIRSRKSEVVRAGQVLDALSPLKVLDRGYTVALTAQGSALKSVNDVKSGDELNLRLRDGSVWAQVIDTPVRSG